MTAARRAALRALLPTGVDGLLVTDLVNIRYLWETGARVKTQGQTLVITATFPIPSVKLR